MLGELEELSDADALNDSDVDLPGEQLCSLILQELLELVHEDD